jgi:adenine deaminase
MGEAVNELSKVQSFLHAMPKMELHCHLLGAVRRATFQALVHKTQAPISQAEVAAFYTRGDKPVGVLRVLRALDALLLLSADDYYRIAWEYFEDIAAHQVRYTEFFWNPTGTAQISGLAYPQVLAALRRAMQDAEKHLGVVARLIPAIDREASARDALHRADEVLGIGIDYREVDRPPEMFAQAYALARGAGLKTTAHAGEFGMPWQNVRTAVDVLKVDRIDHGYTVVDNPEFAKRMAQSGMVFTVVPTNSYYLRTLAPERWALDHPIRQMAQLGLRMHPNTDDPALHFVNPTQAWHMMVRDFGCSIGDVRAMMVNGFDGAWIDETVRRDWRGQWLAQFDQLRLDYQL